MFCPVGKSVELVMTGRQDFKDSDFGHKDDGHGQQGQHGQRRSFWRELFD